jgi:hypothetical protein
MQIKNFANIMLGTAILLFSCPVMLSASDSPLFLQHTLISYQQIEDNVILDYDLIIENTGDASIYNLTLTQVPLLFIATDEVILTAGDLPGQASTEISLRFTTPMLLNEEKLSQQPLFWIGEYQDEAGLQHDFPFESHPDQLTLE